MCSSEALQKRTVSTKLNFDDISFAVPHDPHLSFVSSPRRGIRAFLQYTKANFVSVQMNEYWAVLQQVVKKLSWYLEGREALRMTSLSA